MERNLKFKEKFNALLGLPKSLVFNIKAFGFKKGIKLPIILGSRCKYKGIRRGAIDINSNYNFAHIKLGVNYGPFEKGLNEKTVISLGESAKVSFLGECNVSSGSVINISNGNCVFGMGFAANSNFLLSCEKEIIFGDNILFGWSCTVMDGDGHFIVNEETGEKLNEAKEVHIKNHVWVAAESTILKGSTISENSIIGYGSIVSREFLRAGCIIAGTPAKVISENKNWIR